MSKSLAQEMMDDFLRRQQEYERIYKTYQFKERSIEEPKNQRPHKLRDAVIKARMKYQESRRLLKQSNKKENDYNKKSKILRRRDCMEKSIQLRKTEQNKQIDLGLILVITIPIVCFFTLLSELI